MIIKKNQDGTTEASMTLNMMNATGDGKLSVTVVGETEEEAKRKSMSMLIDLLNEFNRKYGTNIRIFL